MEVLVQHAIRILALVAIALGISSLGAMTQVSLSTAGVVAAAANPALRPAVAEWEFVSGSTTPPSQAACNAVGRRCFNPSAMANSYNYASLHAAGNQGQGTTIAVIDSFGSATVANDLSVFN